MAHEPIDRTNEVIDLEREYTRLQRANPSDQKTLADVVGKRERMEAGAQARGWEYRYDDQVQVGEWRLYPTSGTRPNR